MPYKKQKDKQPYKNKQLKLVKRKKKKKPKFKDLLNLLLRLLIFPPYLAYVILKTAFIEKPLEILQKIKDESSYSYYKSKKYYKKAKKFAVEDVDSDGEDSEPTKGCSVKKKPKTKTKKKGLIKKLLTKLVLLLKKMISCIGKAIIKFKNFKKYSILKIKWIVGKIYKIWMDTEIIVFKLKALPFIITEKLKAFVKESIEENYIPFDPAPPVPKRTPPPPLIRCDTAESVEEVEIIKTVTVFPDSYRQMTSRYAKGSVAQPLVKENQKSCNFQISQKQTLADVPSLQHVNFHPMIDFNTPPPPPEHRVLQSHEEMVDNYFKTFDAVQGDETDFKVKSNQELNMSSSVEE